MGVAFVTRLLGQGVLPPPVDPEEAARLIHFHGLEGLALARHTAQRGAQHGARHRAAEEGPLPPDLVQAFEPAYRTQGLTATLLLESVSRARSVLADEGVDALLFKGAALVGDGTYPDPGARRMDDADVLVRPHTAGPAVAALREAGFEPVTGWNADQMGWADAVTLHDREGPAGTELTLDLHWRTEYDRLRFGGRGESVLWEGADLEAGVPAPETHLVIVVEHFLKHLRFKIHLAALSDMVRLAGRVRDWGRVDGLVGRSRLERGARALLCTLARDLGAPVPRPFSDGVPGDLHRAFSPDSLLGRRRLGGGRLAGIAHRWRLLGTPRRVAADLADAAFPSREWLAARYGRGGAGAWLRYVGDVARWSVYRGRSPASPNQELFDPTARE